VPAVAWQFRLFEPELGRIDEFVPEDGAAVDVGVWWGPWSWWLAKRVPRVDSFEPNAGLVGRVGPVLPANVNLHQVALSDSEGRSSLWIPTGGTGTEGRASLEPGVGSVEGWRKLSVPTARLDDFSLRDVGFIKIDVEGHELAVLHGAAELLGNQRPNLLIEIEQHSSRPHNLDAVIDYLRTFSYAGEYLNKGTWHPIEELDRVHMRNIADRSRSRGYVKSQLLDARRYVHNFVFKPR